jgi:hypothetical protein
MQASVGGANEKAPRRPSTRHSHPERGPRDQARDSCERGDSTEHFARTMVRFSPTSLNSEIGPIHASARARWVARERRSAK